MKKIAPSAELKLKFRKGKTIKLMTENMTPEITAFFNPILSAKKATSISPIISAVPITLVPNPNSTIPRLYDSSSQVA